MNNIELNKVAIQSIGIDTIRLPGVGSASAKGSGSLFHKSLVDAWFMSGYSNDNPPASIKGYKGHELVLKNFAFAGSSGFGKYVYDRTNYIGSSISYVNQNTFKIFAKGNPISESKGIEGRVGEVLSGTIPAFKIKVSGIPNNSNVLVNRNEFNGETSVYPVVISKLTNGIHTIPAYKYNITPINSSSKAIIRDFRLISFEDISDVTVEFLPDNAGSLVFDGVDDYAVCDNMPMQTDYTVICRREIINTNKSSAVASKRTYPDNIGSFGAFVIERVTANGSKALYSFGKDNAVDSFNSNQIIYQSKTAYNDRNIIAGDASDTNILSLGANAYNLSLGRCQEFSNVAIYYFALYDKSLTPDEIEQEKIKLNEIWTKRLNG